MFTLDNFYKSDEWVDLVSNLKHTRLNENGDIICEHCGSPIVKAYDCIGHHKIELTDANVNDYNISLNEDNIMLVHHKCHNQLHARFGYEGPQKIYIVYGSPCAGKSTWVKESAGKDDLIVDVDKIWEAITINDKFNKSKRLLRNVLGVRDCIIDQILIREGKWKNAYIIGGYPLSMERKRLADKLNAELVFIDESKETCKSRALNSEWEKLIDDWFDMYIE